MDLIPTTLPDVIAIQPEVRGDARGFFMETYHAQRFMDAGLPTHFVQDNHSRSRQGTLRGLHYQIRQAQGKLVRAIAGEIYDVAVDIRRSSPTFGQWVGLILSAENKQQLWVPAGFAHGFYVLSDFAEVTYKTTDFYAPEWERTILWNDPVLGVEWPIPAGQAPLLSPKDLQGKPLREADLFD
ncbi:MAG: dTDP-4-dehydrorhamnose 3,5-epimerase [Chloroflexota bacterium]